MSVNRFKPHLYVLPEDDANRQIAVGFQTDPSVRTRCMQILPVAGGWRKALAALKDEHIQTVAAYPHCHFILLIDFDESRERRELAIIDVPPDLVERIFVLGTWSEPERIGEGSLESFGARLAEACRTTPQQEDPWQHQLWVHNATEVARAKEKIAGWLFD